ncbi:MAG: hypothetical protein OJF49_002784 [Ktedonobacterales bacterium]|nr:MAG: hypothetical protein OJF49_002784 [Ktedonobacterales bacterium]
MARVGWGQRVRSWVRAGGSDDILRRIHMVKGRAEDSGGREQVDFSV